MSFATYEVQAERLAELLPGCTLRANLLFHDATVAGPIVQYKVAGKKDRISALCPFQDCLKFKYHSKMPGDLANNMNTHLVNVHNSTLGVMSERAPGDRESLGGEPKTRQPIDIVPVPVKTRGVAKKAASKKKTPTRKAKAITSPKKSTTSTQKLIKEEPAEEQNDNVPEEPFEVTNASPQETATPALPISNASFSYAKITADEACIHFYKAILEPVCEMEKIGHLERVVEVLLGQFLQMTPEMAASRGKELTMLQSDEEEMAGDYEVFPQLWDEALFYTGF
jgi:hypothetical protein